MVTITRKQYIKTIMDHHYQHFSEGLPILLISLKPVVQTAASVGCPSIE